MNSRYPLSLRKLQDGQILSRRVHDATEESVYVSHGWSPKVPTLPEPAPLVDHTAQAIGTLAAGMAEIGAQIAALLERIEALEKQKRGPGRPAKE